MFIPWNDPDSVRLTGRWSNIPADYHENHIFTQPSSQFTTTTAPGSYFELAFKGRCVRLRFDLGYLGQPFPHLWVQIDNGSRVEVPVDRFLRIEAESDGVHKLTVLYKGGMEMLPRWHQPLMGAISFIGAEVEEKAVLEPDPRKIIEFLGDSITEGVLTDADYSSEPANLIDQFNRPYQDDNTATYASLTAKALNLRAMFQAYGAIGLTRSGCGSVPRAGEIYPYVFDGVPYTGPKPDIILINHGANDRGASADEYLARYAELLELILSGNPEASIICLSAFCGAFDRELGEFCKNWNLTHSHVVHFISSAGWVPLEPLHPLREGHRIIAEHLIPLLPV